MRLLRTATHAAVASSVHGKVQRRQQAKWAQATAAAPAAAAAPTPAPAAAPANDMSATLEQLKQLGELRDAGILTPDEFEAKKAAILS